MGRDNILSKKDSAWITRILGFILIGVCVWVYFFTDPNNKEKDSENLKCRNFHNGTFVYYRQLDTKITKKISIKGDIHLEKSIIDSSYIKSKIFRQGDCDYVLEITEMRMDSTTRKVGDAIKVSILYAEEDTMRYSVYRDGKTKDGVLVKVSDTTPLLP